jgi:hypothetical protein
MERPKTNEGALPTASPTRKPVSRRTFLSYAGALGATVTLAGVAAGCTKDNDSDGINLGSGDTGILNYAYALEQLEAAFYKQVTDTPFSGMTAVETAFFADIRAHEIGHREFFKKVLAGSAIPGLEVDFSSINFSSRDSVLATAKAFEDLGVSAYNGAGRLLTNPAYLLVAGKIVSVEARHAAAIRDIIAYNSFADNTVVDANGLDKSRTPAEVLAIAGPYLKSRINASNLPNN